MAGPESFASGAIPRAELGARCMAIDMNASRATRVSQAPPGAPKTASAAPAEVVTGFIEFPLGALSARPYSDPAELWRQVSLDLKLASCPKLRSFGIIRVGASWELTAK